MTSHDHATRRAPLAFAALAALALATTACGGYNSMFPRREDIYKPIPVTLGEQRVAGADTSYVLVGHGYRVTTRERDLLPDAKTTLDRVAGAYRRYFSADPPTVDVVLRPANNRDRRKRDKQRGADSARSDAGRGGADSSHVVTMYGWLERDGDDPRRAMMAGMRASAVALPLARAWLTAVADTLVGPLPRAASPTTATPTAATPTAAAGDSASRAATPPRDDPRVPDWIERAVPALVANAPGLETASLQVAQASDKLIPLRTLVSTARPAAAGGKGAADSRDPVRRDGREGREGLGERGERGEPRPIITPGRGARSLPALSGAALFDAEAVSLAQFLAEKEGRPFVGRLTEALLRGRSFDEALRGATAVPTDPDALEKSWRSWLLTQKAEYEDRAGR